MRLLSGLFSVFLVVSAGAGCSGAKLLKEPKPVARTEPLLIHADENLATMLVWVIVRDGPGTWAKNVDWDEYHLVVRNITERAIEINDVVIVDQLGYASAPSNDRAELVDRSKATVRRFKNQDIKIQAGAGAVRLLVTGTVVTAGTMVLIGASAAPTLGSALTAAAAAGTVAIIAIPTVFILATRRAYNNQQVHDRIAERYTPLPMTLEPEVGERLVLFYGLTPAPRRIVVLYTANDEPRRLELDTRELLAGLHLDPDD